MRRWINALLSLTISLAAALITVPSFGQTTAASMAPSPHSASIPSDSPKLSGAQPASASAKPGAAATGQPNEAEMMKQMAELAKLNENHKLLASMAGTWSYIVKFWMAPGAPPSTSTGTAVRKAMMDDAISRSTSLAKCRCPARTGR